MEKGFDRLSLTFHGHPMKFGGIASYPLEAVDHPGVIGPEPSGAERFNEKINTGI